MIKKMESERMQISRLSENEISLTINGRAHGLTVDELNELRSLADHFWNANELWQWTAQAIAERQRWEEVKDNPLMAEGQKLPQLRNW